MFIKLFPSIQQTSRSLSNYTHIITLHSTLSYTLNVNNSHGRLSDWPCGVGTDSGSSLMDLFCSADGNNRNSVSKSKQSAGIILARKQTRGSDARHTHTHTPKIDSGPADCDPSVWDREKVHTHTHTLMIINPHPHPKRAAQDTPFPFTHTVCFLCLIRNQYLLEVPVENWGLYLVYRGVCVCVWRQNTYRVTQNICINLT